MDILRSGTGLGALRIGEELGVRPETLCAWGKKAQVDGDLTES